MSRRESIGTTGEISIRGAVPSEDSPEYEDEIDRIHREKHKFRRLSEAEAARLFEEEIERLEDEYDVARAREIRKAVREGLMELVGGQELEEDLDRICGSASRQRGK